MKLTETLEKCPNCGGLFYRQLSSRAELHVKLDDKESIFIYCKESCLTTKLTNMNSGNVPFGIKLRIKNESRIEATKNSPVIYRIDLVAEYPHLKGAYVT